MVQARVPGVDGDAAAGHLPAVLCSRHHARLYRCHEPGLRLEQEGGWYRAQQLLLGLLPDSGGGRPPWGSVTNPFSPLLRLEGGPSPRCLPEAVWSQERRGRWRRSSTDIWEEEVGCGSSKAVGTET